MLSLRHIAQLVQQFRDARPEALDPVVTGWTGAATTAATLLSRAGDIDRDTATTFTNNGAGLYDAATATARTRAALGDGGEHYDHIARAAAVVRDELATTKTGVLSAWRALIDEITAIDDATTSLARAASTMTQPQVDAQAAALQARADQALTTHGATITRLIDSYEGVLTSRLGVLADLGFTEPAAAHTPIPAPPAGGSPGQVNSWWTGLTPEQQADLIQTDPGQIGNLDGIPATVRDEANRARLGTEIARIDAELITARARFDQVGTEQLSAGSEGQGETLAQAAVREHLVELFEQRAALDTVQVTLAGMSDRQLLLLDLTHDRPRAAVAVGDVGTADHVAVFTPGMETDVAGELGSYIQDMNEMRQTAQDALFRRHRPDETVAAVAWLGYEPPQASLRDLLDPDHTFATAGDAEHGGADLSRFLDGINASRDTEPHLTALGHSYGSTTTGYALQEARGVDDAVLFGSPGAGTGDVTDLHVPRGHLAVVEARGDAVADLGSFGGDANQLDGITGLSAHEERLPDGLVLRESTGHSEYLAPGTTSQYNIALTVAGLNDRRILAGSTGAGDWLRAAWDAL